MHSLRNIFQIPDLRRRILFTFAMLLVYRVGCHVPLPGIDLGALLELVKQLEGSYLGFFNVFTGGSLERAAVFALGIMPYITASILLQLLTVVVPRLEKLSKEGELGRRKLTQYTRYGALGIALIEGASIAFTVEGMIAPGGAALVLQPGWGFRLTTMLTLATGCALVMWLGEQITERGLGNGISLIIFAGIVITLPEAIASLFQRMQGGLLHPVVAILLVGFFALVTAFIVFMERSQRRIPVRYAKRVAGRSVYGGQRTYLPLRLNTGGVIPVIFASAVLVLPGTLATLAPADWTWFHGVADVVANGQPAHYLLYGLAILGFCFFYVSIVFNPQDTAENLRRSGGFLPGIRSGRPTAEYLDRVLTRLTLIGAVYLAAVAILPELLLFGVRVGGIPWIGPALERTLPEWLTHGIGIDFYFGGTSLLIVVAVAMDFVQQVESQLVMRRYDSFLKRGGRRDGGIS